MWHRSSSTTARPALSYPAIVGLVVAAMCSSAPSHGRVAARAAHQDRYRFDDVTRAAGVTGRSRTWGSTWIDLDDDGDPELFVGRHWAHPKLFDNRGAAFEPMHVDAFHEDAVDRHACAWGEANGDGRPDLYCARGADRGTGSGPKQLFIGPRLAERARAFGVRYPLARGRTVNWLDYDSDRDLDIFLGSTTRSGAPNAMFRNDGDGFTQVGAGVGEELSTVASAWADWDGDGDPDLLVMQHSPFETIAYRNDDGRFVRADVAGLSGGRWTSGDFGDHDGDGDADLLVVNDSRAAILTNRGGRFSQTWSASIEHGSAGVWFDVENDGDLDAFVVQGSGENFANNALVNQPDLLVVNKGDDGFKVVRDRSFAGTRSGNGDAVASADYDRDGRVDLFVTNGLFHSKGPNLLLRNRSRALNWVGLQLRGDDRNPFGYGSVIVVRTRAGTYKRELNDGFSFRTQSEVGYVHLGIGRASTARLRVLWPGGDRDCLRVENGSIVRLEEGSSPCG